MTKLESTYPQMGYDLSTATFPSPQWETLFRPCASLRLFTPVSLCNVFVSQYGLAILLAHLTLMMDTP